MSQFAKLTSTNKTQLGVRMVVAGQEKMGKTTFCASAPKPILLPTEAGYHGIANLDYLPEITTYPELMAALDEVIYYASQGNFPYRTIIIDSATATERFIHEQVLSMDVSHTKSNKKAVTMESALGGYGKAYTYANELFNKLLIKCDEIALKHGINVILTCHTFAAKIIDPTVGEFDSWDLLLHSPKNQKTYGKRELITQWADVIGFLYDPLYVTQGENVNLGISANKGRQMGLTRTPSYIAGNRYGVVGEITMPAMQGWNYFADAVLKASTIDIFH